MTQRENLLSLLKRKGFDFIPPQFDLCPALEKRFREETGAENYYDYYEFPWRFAPDLEPANGGVEKYEPYLPRMAAGSYIDAWGVGHEPSPNSMHMSYMHHPLKDIHSKEEILSYPFPDYSNAHNPGQAEEIQKIHDRGLAAVGGMQCTIWETAWYLRSMEELMMDMISGDEKAEILLDHVTALNTARAEAFVRSGVDILYIGDDIGMQHSIMMSEELYCEWIKPRLKGLIAAAKAINPELVVLYHSCGYVVPFIPHLMEAGIDVLTPLQSECMEFQKIHEEYGDVLSFHGTIGTQTIMPFGTPQEVREAVFRNLDLCGSQGGLMVAPTHLLEPEVPYANIEAYVQACRDYK